MKSVKLTRTTAVKLMRRVIPIPVNLISGGAVDNGAVRFTAPVGPGGLEITCENDWFNHNGCIKVANKVAGMVDLVARIVADDNERIMSFKTSEVIFGGGRLTVHKKEIPLDYAAFCEVYDEANQRAAERPADSTGTDTQGNTPPPPQEPENGAKTGRRRSRKKTDDPAPEPKPDEAPPADDPAPEPEPAPFDPTQLPTCPDGERIFRQHEENPNIPLCPSIDAAHRCHKDGGPDNCPLWDRPKPEAEVPMMGVNENKPVTETTEAPRRRTRKKRGES